MSIESVLTKIQEHAPRHPQLLRQLAEEAAKPGGFEKLIDILRTSEAARLRLKFYIARVFHYRDLTYALVESGISRRTGFTSEIIRKIKHTILPEEKDHAAFHETLNRIFAGGKMNLFNEKQLTELFSILQPDVSFNDKHLKSELIDAIEVLSYRITATAIESEFIRKFRFNKTLGSFIRQNKEIHALIAQYTLGINFNPHLVAHIKQLLDESLADIRVLQKRSHHQGASLQLTYSLHRLTQQIERLKLLFDIYLEPALTPQRLSKLVVLLIKNESQKNSIRKQLDESTYLLAHQITEHESKTGEHYIAEGRAGYVSMFISSCKGGLFAVLMMLVKLLLHGLRFAPFWQAFAYSINYAAGFVGIQITHSTLATKQPAMTASKVAHALDNKDSDEHSIKGLALMIGKVSRSQFISFVGNLIIVFPVSFAIAWLWLVVTGKPLVSTQQAWKMMNDIHPFKNPTWYYACITGVFLFLSGIISGYYDNKVIYSSIPSRVRHHAFLQKFLRKRTLIRLSNYIEHGLGSLIGNISLGIFLGTAGFIGFIFGLPFDIRHITISSGNYSVALFTLLFSIKWQYALICLLGVIGIGVFNFLVSFSLAIFIAARSRKVKAAQFLELLKWTGKYFIRYPKDFFIPGRKERSVDEL